MDKAVILTGGEEVSKKTLMNFINNNTYVICADKGGETALKYNIDTDVLLGDFDSINKEAICRLGAKTIKYPAEKDYTDTELAIEHAVEKGFKEIILLNATGGRPDHELANFMLMAKYKDYNLKIAGNNFFSFLLKENIKLENMKDMVFSLIPLSSLKEVSLEGFLYEIKEKNISIGESLCISNIIASDIAEISISEGTAIVIISETEKQNERKD